MAADEERAARIREQKEQHPGMTWRQIADYVDVSERAAVEWQKTGAIEYENCRKLAQIFEVDFDWLWRGVDKSVTPDPFSGSIPGASEPQFTQLQERIAALADAVEAHDTFAREKAKDVRQIRDVALDRINERLTRIEQNQDSILGEAGEARQLLLAMSATAEQLAASLSLLETKLATLETAPAPTAKRGRASTKPKSATNG